MLIDLLFPTKCIFCGRALHAGIAGAAVAVCRDCESGIPYYESAYLFTSDGARSRDGGRPCCDRIVCAFRYEGIVSSALMRYKFYQKPEFGKTFAAFLCEKVKRVENGRARGEAPFDIVTCVPLSKRREKERGYNQAGIVARYAAEYFGCPFEERLLLRDAAAMRQSRLSSSERAANARAAYGHDPSRAAAASGKRVLLVDDIATTFATINACAGALKTAGAASVVGGVIAARIASRAC